MIREKSWWTSKPNAIALLNFERLTIAGEELRVSEEYRVIYFEKGEEERVKEYAKSVITPAAVGVDGFNPGFILFGAEAKAALYDMDYAKLSEFEQFLIDTVIFESQADGFKSRAKSVDKLLRVAGARLRKSGFMVTCSRCGGSGHYSYCERYGTSCFKCEGNKMTLPRRITKRWKADVAAFNWKDAYTPKQDNSQITGA